MSRNSDNDWSDSDDEAFSEVETSVLLGVPDGFIHVNSDLTDAAVSRIGGLPALLPSRQPHFSSSQCRVCSSPMEMLVQLWCPFENSPMDRALYIWGCPRVGCQGKPGSVRAWRGLRFNEKYAAKLEKKLAKEKEQKHAQITAGAIAKNPTKSNPFSMANKSSQMPEPFGLGAQIFGTSAAPSPSPAGEVLPANVSQTKEDGDEDDTSDAESDSALSEKSLLTAMASTTITESPWQAAPAYPALYLSTISEYLPPQPKNKLPPGVQVVDQLSDDNGKNAKDFSWMSEAYENSLEVDAVFERFTKRVGYEGEQCIRYELNGTPLPFASDDVFERLFPAPAVPPLPVTKPDFMVIRTPKRSYTTNSIPHCPQCKSKRVFECQLMPNLINVLRTKDDGKSKKLTDEERKKAVELAIKGGNSNDKREMEWGTCMIFSCAADCCVNDDGTSTKECWREELVLVQWDV